MLVQANSRQRYKEMYEVKFIYTKEVKQKCINLDTYDVILPQNGEELFRYADQLQNCMAGYAQSIKIIGQQSIFFTKMMKFNLLLKFVKIHSFKLVQNITDC